MYDIIVEEQIIRKDLNYRNKLVLSYTIKYPKFYSNQFQAFLREMNIQYKIQAYMYEMYNVTNLYQMASEQYDYSVLNQFPFHPYETIMEYTITYNQNCVISLYFDKYEYTGGAHGMTYRTSDTWDLNKGDKLQLSDIIIGVPNIREYIKHIIIQSIESDIAAGQNYYFEDYAKLVEENLNIKNFYLDQDGVIIYFQLYEIAPYASGIRTFLIPYNNNTVIEPSC